VEYTGPIGPVLFVIICQICVSKLLKSVCGYIKLYKHVTCEDDHGSLQMGLDVVQELIDRWLLKLNISKCKTVFCVRNINHYYNYYLHATELEKVNKMKDLDVTFYPELSFDFHCEEKTNKE